MEEQLLQYLQNVYYWASPGCLDVVPAGIIAVDLGGDNDQLWGFGRISADGGEGVDSLFLDDGEYSFDFNTNVLSSNRILMTVTDFELYGGRETDKLNLLQFSAETTSFTIKNGILLA